MISKKYDRFLRDHADIFKQFGDLRESGTAKILYAMAHDVCDTEAEADTAALRNVWLFAAEHQGDTLHATFEHLSNPMSRLRLWEIADARGQARWMAALNLRQLKNWHAKGLRNFAAEIDQHVQAIKRDFSAEEIRELDLLQPSKGMPVFGMLASAAAAAIGGVVIRGWWQ